MEQPAQQIASPQFIPLTVTQPITVSQQIPFSSPTQTYSTQQIRPLSVSQVITKVAPPKTETIKGNSPATVIKEIEVEERYEIVPVTSRQNVIQKKDEPLMLNYQVPREAVEEPREPPVRERRSPKPKPKVVEKERAAAPPPEPEEEPEPPRPEPEIVVRQHRIEVPVDVLRIVEKTVQVPVEKVVFRCEFELWEVKLTFLS